MESAPARVDRLFHFIGSHSGPWRVESMRTVIGEPLPNASHITVAGAANHVDAAFLLRGMTSNERYVIRTEKTELVSRQEGLGRPASTRAALIPIRKSAAWWALPQDERRHILETQSQHIRIGMKYLPAVARRLHHCRDLGPDEPFDFITWFEYAPADAQVFDELVEALRGTEEWRYFDREVDIRLVKDEP